MTITVLTSERESRVARTAAASDKAQLATDHTPISVQPFKCCAVRDGIFYLACCASCGILLLFSYWYRVKFTKLRRVKCSLEDADIILVKTEGSSEILRPITKLFVRQLDLARAVPRCLLQDFDVQKLLLEPKTAASSNNSPQSGGQPSLPSVNLYKPPLTEAALCKTPTRTTNLIQTTIPLTEHSANWIFTQSFEFLCRRFIFVNDKFVNVAFDIDSVPLSEIRSRHNVGVSEDAVESVRGIYGVCEVIVPSSSSWNLVLTECLNVFYIFQIVSILLWIVDKYYWYSIAIALLSGISLICTIRETCENNANLQRMARFSCMVSVTRITKNLETKTYEINSRDLIPGDVIELHRGMKLPCDLLLLYGNVLVDESMMTGESTPVHKSALPNTHNKHILYGCSTIQDTSGVTAGTCCIAVVVKVGYATMQGDMMRRLVHSEPSSRLDFETEAYKFVGLLACISCFAFFWTIFQGIVHGLHVFTIVKRSLDTVTITVPPALPIIISVGTSCATKSLKEKHGARCLLPSRINVAGRASVAVFDKTGTLTQDDEDLYAVVPTTLSSYSAAGDFLEASSHSAISVSLASSNAFAQSTQSFSSPPTENSTAHRGPAEFSPHTKQRAKLAGDLLTGLATCHNLGIIDGVLSGDRLEYQMVKFTGWDLIPPQEDTGVTAALEGTAKAGSSGQVTDDQFDHNDFWCVGKVEWSVTESASPYNRMATSLAENCHIPVVNPHHRSDTLQVDIISRRSQISDFGERCEMAGQFVDDDDDGNTDVPVPILEYSFGIIPEYAIVKVFGFDPSLKRMSVIVRNLKTSKLIVYCKGAPEMIQKLSMSETCPSDWDEVLCNYNRQGLRVLAIARKELTGVYEVDVNTLERSEVESGLLFLALLLFTNLLRPDSRGAIQELKDAGLCCYMATGDGIVTASAIAAEVGIVSPTANTLITGSMNENGKLTWSREPFCSAKKLCSDSDAEEVTVMVDHITPIVKVSSSASLLPLLGGCRHSDLCLAITGEALRHIVAAADLTGSERLPEDQGSRVSETFLVIPEFTRHNNSRHQTYLSFCGLEEKKIMFERYLTSAVDSSKKMVPCPIDLREFVLRYFQVFGRLSPGDKELLVEQMQTQLPHKPIVIMCGDGANDCAALRVADVGISLSSQEASIAALFNSTQKTIRVVLDVLREGRGALISSSQNFQFVAIYALVQLCTVTLLSRFAGYLGDRQFLYVDLIEVLPLTYFMSVTDTSRVLHQVMPAESLLAWSILTSLFGHILIHVILQVLAVFWLVAIKDNYLFTASTPAILNANGEDVKSIENTVLFLVSNVQMVVTASVLSLGMRPWKNVFRNFGFMTIVGIYMVVGIGLILNEAPYVQWLRTFLELVSLILDFRLQLLALVCCNVMVTFLFEFGVVQAVRRLEYKSNDNALNRAGQRGRHERIISSS